MNTQKKMINQTVIAIVVLGAGLLCSNVSATDPPPCPPCWSNWPDCDVWDCSAGEDCCDNDEVCCDGECCDSDQCCTNSGCITLDKEWRTSSGPAVEIDPALVDAVNDAIGQIPGMPSVACTGVVLYHYYEERDCCDNTGQTIKNEKCAHGMAAIYASVDKITLWNFNGSLEISVGDLFGASLTVGIEAYIEGEIGATASVGRYINECEGESCNTGSVSMSTGVTLGASASLETCLILFGAEYCVGAGIDASATIEFSSDLRLNQCGDCDGLSGCISLDTLRVDVSFWTNGESDNESWDLLSQN